MRPGILSDCCGELACWYADKDGGRWCCGSCHGPMRRPADAPPIVTTQGQGGLF
jgi:hypothetical protein